MIISWSALVAITFLVALGGFTVGWVARMPRVVELEDRLDVVRHAQAETEARAHAAEARTVELGHLARGLRRRLATLRHESQEAESEGARLRTRCDELLRALELEQVEHMAIRRRLRHTEGALEASLGRQAGMQARLDAVLAAHHRHRDVEEQLAEAQDRIRELEAFGAMEAHLAAGESHRVERLRRDLEEAHETIARVTPAIVQRRDGERVVS